MESLNTSNTNGGRLRISSSLMKRSTKEVSIASHDYQRVDEDDLVILTTAIGSISCLCFIYIHADVSIGECQFNSTRSNQEARVDPHNALTVDYASRL